jgi:hypothetical protein
MNNIQLTESEKAVLQATAEAWNQWVKLQNRTNDDDIEFQQSIHQLQCLIALRVARRADPSIWRQQK